MVTGMDTNDGEQVDHAGPPHEVLPPAALHDVMMGNQPQLPVEAGAADSTAQADTRDEGEIGEEELAEGKLGIGRALGFGLVRRGPLWRMRQWIRRAALKLSF